MPVLDMEERIEETAYGYSYGKVIRAGICVGVDTDSS